MIGRFWRSIKYKCIYINAFQTVAKAMAGIGKRPHSSHGVSTPDEAYDTILTIEKMAV